MVSIQIAIDGPAASGKSTVARLVAARLGGFYINTGDMYRTLTWLALERGIAVETQPDELEQMLGLLNLEYGLAEDGKPVLLLDGTVVPQERIRAPEVTAQVSAIASAAAVRQWLLPRQRQTRRLGLIVMEGRDIGTVVFPDTAYKFFVTASPEVRARRRLGQAGETLPAATVASVAAELAERDRRDQSRELAPLRPAADAVVVDTDELSADQVAALIAERVRHAQETQA